MKHLAHLICPLLLWVLHEEHSEGAVVWVVGWLGPDSVEKEQVYSMWMASQPNSNSVSSNSVWVGLVQRWGERTYCSLTDSDTYTLFWVGLGILAAHETWIQSGGKVLKWSVVNWLTLRDFPQSSIKHCFTCVLVAQQEWVRVWK